MMSRAKGQQDVNFRSASQIRGMADKYFSSLKGVQAVDDEGAPMFDKNGAPVMSVPESPPTVTGLALALGFSSRTALLSYKGKKAYEDVISHALSQIEEYGEAALFDKGLYSGAKFFLANNFSGWNDKPDDSEAESIRRLDVILAGLSEIMRGGG